METLMVLTGNSELPPDLVDRYSQYEILKLDDYKDKYKEFNETEPVLKSIKVLNDLNFIKSKKEFDTKSLYSRIIYLNTDFIRNQGTRYYHYDFERYQFDIEDNILYTPMFTEVEYLYKTVVMPSTSLWFCSSLTFNIISTLDPIHFNLDKVDLYATEPRDAPSKYINLRHYEAQFFNLLGSFNIRIKPVTL